MNIIFGVIDIAMELQIANFFMQCISTAYLFPN